MTSTGVPDDTYTLAWYCVQLLIDTMRDVSPPPSHTSQNPKGKSKAQEKVEADNDATKADDYIHRLSLMLISTISSLPITLMLRALEEIRIIITACSHSRSQDDSGVESEAKGRKEELLEVLFSEILEKVGDREKEAAIKWWYKYRPALISESGDRGEEEKQQQGSLGTVLLASSSWFTKCRRGVEKAKDVDVAGEREENQSSNSPVLSRL
jgi:hypothetical protein